MSNLHTYLLRVHPDYKELSLDHQDKEIHCPPSLEIPMREVLKSGDIDAYFKSMKALKKITQS